MKWSEVAKGQQQVLKDFFQVGIIRAFLKLVKRGIGLGVMVFLALLTLSFLNSGMEYFRSGIQIKPPAGFGGIRQPDVPVVSSQWNSNVGRSRVVVERSDMTLGNVRNTIRTSQSWMYTFDDVMKTVARFTR